MVVRAEGGMEGRAVNVIRQLRSCESKTISTHWPHFADERVGDNHLQGGVVAARAELLLRALRVENSW